MRKGNVKNTCCSEQDLLVCFLAAMDFISNDCSLFRAILQRASFELKANTNSV